METLIKTANKSDEIALKRLFLNSFDDTLSFVNMFFAHHFNPENTVCAFLEEKLVGEAHLLPCKIGDAPCFYAYGICVDAEVRGQGIGKRLLDGIKNFAKERGAAVLLHPANSELFTFYESAGFTPCGEWFFEDIDTNTQPATLLPVTAAEYNAIRNAHFKNAIVWDDSAVEYALSQETFFGLSPYKIITDGRQDIVLCGKDSDFVFIKETTANGDVLSAIAATLSQKLDCPNVRALLQNGNGEKTVCGYGYGTPKNVYMNLLLD